MGDALWDAIVAAPDDDAPRLVWADREGGARGELVVVQCRLQDTTLSRPERRRLAWRERELVRQLTEAWVRPGAPTFARGFIRGIGLALEVLERHGAAIVRDAPLIDHLAIRTMNTVVRETIEGRWAALLASLDRSLEVFSPGQLRSYESGAMVTVVRDNLPSANHGFGDSLAEFLSRHSKTQGVRSIAFTSGDTTRAATASFARLPELEKLDIGFHQLGPGGATAMLRALPRLKEFGVRAGEPRIKDELADFIPAAKNLTGLSLRANTLDDDAVGMLSELSGLERLHLELGTKSLGPGFRKLLGRLDRLVELEISGYQFPEELSPLLSASCAQRLRRLAFWGPKYDNETARPLLGLPALEDLTIQKTHGEFFGSLKELTAELPRFRLVE